MTCEYHLKTDYETSKLCDGRTKTVCSQSSQMVSKEVCVYGYSQNIVVAHLQLAEITFEKRTKKFGVSRCKKAILAEGYKQKHIETCEEEEVETSYRLPSIVGPLDDFLELNLAEPEVRCQLYKYDIPEVTCQVRGLTLPPPPHLLPHSLYAGRDEEPLLRPGQDRAGHHQAVR